MNKKSEIDTEINKYTLPRMGYYGGMGLAGGIGIGGLMELVRQVRAEREDNERMKRKQDTSSDTIVLTIPSKNREPIQKLAAQLDILIPDAAAPYTTKAAQEVPSIKQEDLQRIQGMPEAYKTDVHGSTGREKEWTGPQVALSGLGLIGGAYGGLKIMETLGSKYREMMLRKRLEAAKRNHINTLLGMRGDESKVASVEGMSAKDEAEAYLEDFFGDPMLKKAQSTWENIKNTGSGAWDTFNNKAKGVKDWWDSNVVKTVLPKGEAGPSNADKAIGTTLLLAMLGSGATAYATKRVLDERSTEQDKEDEDLMERPNVSRIVLKTAETSVDADNVDALTSIALSVLAHKRQAGYLKTASIVDAAAKHGLTPDDIINKLNHEDIVGTIHTLKQAEDLWAELRKPFEKQSAGIGEFLSSTTGADIPAFMDMSAPNKEPKGVDVDALADAVVARMKAKPRKPVVVKQKLTISASDPAAQKYMEANKDKIKRIVQQMTSQGTL